MMALVTLALMAAGATGLGLLLLRGFGVRSFSSHVERAVVGFAIGFGALGWLAFIPGVLGFFQSPYLIGVCLVGALGWFLAGNPTQSKPEPIAAMSGTATLLLAGIALAVMFDGFEALPPPTDADSLAYHFALPRDFLAARRVFFVPRAADGAIPLLQHMSYMVALGIGGERAMTLWAMLTGWSAAGVLYVLGRRHLSRDWSLALALLFLTTPVVVYAAGSGQVETRSAAFVLVAVLAAMEARRLDHIGFAALAGLAAGFFAGSKYPGLLFIPLAGLAVVVQRRWFRHGSAFAATALIAAAPFYLWHWWNTGDPFFPMLYGLIDYRSGVPWNPDIHAAFKNWTEAIEKSRPPTLLWAVLYPFMATLAPDATFESGRTGFGPIALLLLPMALAGAWMRRDRLWQSPLTIAAFLCLGFYLAWFLFGASQRVRHFLPVYPLLLLCLVVASARAADALPGWRRPFVAALLATLVFQLAVHAIFAIGPARYLFSDESRDAYLRRSVIRYDIVHWANANLPVGSRLMHIQRQLNYLLSVSYFYAHPLIEARIDLRPEARDPARFWRELAAAGVTHLLSEPDSAADGGIDYLAARLLAMGCLKESFRGEALVFPSRTIMAVSSERVVYKIFSIEISSCSMDSPRVHQPETSRR